MPVGFGVCIAFSKRLLQILSSHQILIAYLLVMSTFLSLGKDMREHVGSTLLSSVVILPLHLLVNDLEDDDHPPAKLPSVEYEFRGFRSGPGPTVTNRILIYTTVSRGCRISGTTVIFISASLQDECEHSVYWQVR